MPEYRYILTREWAPKTETLWSESSAGEIIFILLNPSTADQDQDDPTVRRCVGFGRRLGYSSLKIVNLFAVRSTNPARLKAIDQPVGINNDAIIYDTCHLQQPDLIVAGWGTHGTYLDRDREVMKMLTGAGAMVYCLGTNKNGTPKHPLYLPKDSTLIPYQGR